MVAGVLVLICLLLGVATSNGESGPLQTPDALLLPDVPFVAIWNVPSALCMGSYGVNLNLSAFDIVANEKEEFFGSDVVIFYENRLGLYPRYTEDRQPVNGGLPQLGNIYEHLAKVRRDVDKIIPDANFSGLAVIDWESWRPMFDRNGYNSVQKIYIRESENLVRQYHPDWPEKRVETQARLDFEASARLYMGQTLLLCRSLRPRGHWGFYGFPRCYNYQPGQDFCTSSTLSYNDKLFWLINNSTTIVSSIYLSNDRSDQDRKLRVRGILQETLRMKRLYGGPNVPALAYTRYRFPDNSLYGLRDLKNTVRQSMAAGLAGVTIWDSSATLRTKQDCVQLQTYLKTTLGPYVKKVTKFAKRCSRKYCNNHGRCVQIGWNTTGETMAHEKSLDIHAFLGNPKAYVDYNSISPFVIHDGYFINQLPSENETGRTVHQSKIGIDVFLHTMTNFAKRNVKHLEHSKRLMSRLLNGVNIERRKKKANIFATLRKPESSKTGTRQTEATASYTCSCYQGWTGSSCGKHI